MNVLATARGVLKGKLPSCVHGANVTCFHGPPGSGKTHQMKKRMDALSGHTVVTLSITEAFSMSDVAHKLHLAALEANPTAMRAVCVIAQRVLDVEVNHNL